MIVNRMAIGIAVGILLLGGGELAVRLAPAEWSATTNPPPQPGIRIDPLLGPLLEPGWSGTWFTNFEVVADERGFRSTGAPPPAESDVRVALLGDSCTFGWGIDTQDTFAAQLDTRARAAGAPVLEVVNAAFPGQSAVVGTHMLRERVLPLHPEVVVLGFGANNAFRLSLVDDVDRFRLFGLRKLLGHSTLYRVLGSRMAAWRGPAVDPRDRQLIMQRPLEKLTRVAFLDEFETAVRDMVDTARRAGVKPLLLVLPRASEVSTEHASEDAAAGPALEPRQLGAPPTGRELGLLEVSCLDQRRLPDPVGTLHEQLPRWRRVYPEGPEVRAILQEGASAYTGGAYAAAAARFAAALALDSSSPLARYDLGVAKLAAGDTSGLTDLETADRLACNVFLQYQVALWRIATELRVPIVDITLVFEAHDGESLFVDPAHPNQQGHRLIADALWPAVERLVRSRDGIPEPLRQRPLATP